MNAITYAFIKDQSKWSFKPFRCVRVSERVNPCLQFILFKLNVIGSFFYESVLTLNSLLLLLLLSFLLHFFFSRSCFSMIGRTGGSQAISLGRSCVVQGVIVHELMHAIGFYHMHSRSDRDSYLRILWPNINESMLSQFR